MLCNSPIWSASTCPSCPSCHTPGLSRECDSRAQGAQGAARRPVERYEAPRRLGKRVRVIGHRTDHMFLSRCTIFPLPSRMIRQFLHVSRPSSGLPRPSSVVHPLPHCPPNRHDFSTGETRGFCGAIFPSACLVPTETEELAGLDLNIHL